MSTTAQAAREATPPKPGDIVLSGRALENAQPGHPAHRQTLFEAARGVHARARREVERVVPLVPAHSSGIRDAFDTVVKALGAIDSTIHRTAANAVNVAENNDLYKDGRAARIDTALVEADGVLDNAGGTVEGAADVLRAVLEGEALPKAPADPTPALSTLNTLMAAASDKDKPQLFDRLASRNDPLAGWLLGPHGREYATALWGEAGAARHNSARLVALQAALERGNQHALAARGVADLVSAGGAYKAAWKSIRGNLVALSNDLRGQAEPQ